MQTLSGHKNVCRLPYRSRQYSSIYGRRKAHIVHSQIATIEKLEVEAPSYVSRIARNALFSKAKEVKIEVNASISGSIPSWIEGSLILNGGGDYTGGMKHMFDGYAMLCKLRFSGGKVFGSQKMIKSKSYKHFSETGKLKFREFATAIPATTLPEQASALLDIVSLMSVGKEFSTDNPSVSILPLPDGSMLAMSESVPSHYRMNPDTLEILEQQKYSDGIPGDLTTAHPKVLADGTVINFTRSVPFGGYNIYKQDPVTLKRTKIAFIRDRDPFSPCWVHDFAASENYMVIVEPPLFINTGSVVTGVPTQHIFMDWKPEQGTRVHVIPLNGNSREGVKTFEAPTFFSFHTANAFEDGNRLSVDLSVYDDPTILNDLMLENIMAFPGEEVSRSYLRRINIPLGDVTSSVLSAPQQLIVDESQHGYFTEFPNVSPLKRGKSHRYVWSLGAVRPTNLGNAVTKYDVNFGVAQQWHEAGALPGEPVFIPTPGSTEEDDGVVMSIVMSKSGNSFVLVLDASTMEELGRAELPYSVPYRFHGCFIPN